MELCLKRCWQGPHLWGALNSRRGCEKWAVLWVESLCGAGVGCESDSGLRVVQNCGGRGWASGALRIARAKKKKRKKKVGRTCHVCNLFWLLNLKLRGLDTDCKHFPLIRPHFPLGRSLRRKLELDKDRWFNESAYWNTTHVGRRLHLGPWKHLPWQMLTVWPKWQASPVLVQLHKWISIWGV